MSAPLPETVTLRNGRTVTLRLGTEPDLSSYFDMDRAVVRDGRGVVRTLDDLSDREASIARLRPSLRHLDGGAKGLWLFAIDEDGRVVGDANIKRAPMSLCSHSTMAAVAVHPDAQRQGLGRLLMERMLDWARAAEPEVTRIGLFMVADNHRALALYESLGFEHEGLRRKFVRKPDGTYVDDVVMSLLL